MGMISPEVGYKSYSLTTSEGTSPAIKFQSRGGQIQIPSGSSITSLTWYTSEKSDGTFLPAYIEDGSEAVAQSGLLAGRSYPIPAALFGAPWIKAVANAAGAVIICDKG